ncbi:hypothetical protein AAF712_014898 [Marasmius tenuissimus]|uniref:JmjC domain-containing protein n=1 Tax=Marasmius tenuissimus TaxID=585030 RepID=A0ABR2ZD92_9AGAR
MHLAAFNEAPANVRNKDVADCVFLMRLVDQLKSGARKSLASQVLELAQDPITQGDYKRIPALSAFGEDGWVGALNILVRNHKAHSTAPYASSELTNPEDVLMAIAGNVQSILRKSAYNVALVNFGYVALATAYLLQGHLDFSEAYQAIVDKFDLSCDPAQIHTGLNLALMHPFILFSPKGCNLFTKVVASSTILRWWRAFGNQKSSIMLKLETEFFYQLLLVVDGTQSVELALNNLVNHISASSRELKDRDVDDSAFFCIGTLEGEEDSEEENGLEEDIASKATTKRQLKSKRNKNGDSDGDEGEDVDEEYRPTKKARSSGGSRKGGSRKGGHKEGGIEGVWLRKIRTVVPVDHLPMINSSEIQQRTRVSSGPYELFCASNGNSYQYTPSFYPPAPNAEDQIDPASNLETLLGAVQWVQTSNSLEQGGPVLALPFSRLRDLGKPELLDLFRTKSAILLTDREMDTKDEFSEANLSILGSLEVDRQLHDAALEGKNSDGSTHVVGTLSDMYKARHRGGPILNALDIPSESGIGWIPRLLTSCRQIWANLSATEQIPYPFPMEDMNWYLCALSDALHDWHIDAEGLATWITVLAGKKLWVVGAPGEGDCADHAGLDSFYTCQERSVNWDKHAMLLQAGDTLIMPPNTPHIVVTVEDSIVEGGHFFCSSTIQKTCFGLFHACVALSHVTNNTHETARYVLANISNYWSHTIINSQKYHAALDSRVFDPTLDTPILTTNNGLLDFITLSNVMSLGTALCSEHYDVLVLDGEEKRKAQLKLSGDWIPLYSKACLLAQEALDWFHQHFNVVSSSSGEDCWDDLRYGYLVDQARTLINHRQLFQNDTSGISTHMSSEALQKKISQDFGELSVTLKELWAKSFDSPYQTPGNYFYQRSNFVIRSRDQDL